jgi:hypothetical protein
MVMDWHDAALMAAGTIGSIVAIVHGVLTERLMAAPLRAMQPRPSAPIRRMAPLLLQFSTFNWFVGGLVLVATALWLGPEAKLVAGLLVGSSYLIGAAGNLWATRGRHPGWALYALALLLILYGLAGPGA